MESMDDKWLQKIFMNAKVLDPSGQGELLRGEALDKYVELQLNLLDHLKDPTVAITEVIIRADGIEVGKLTPPSVTEVVFEIPKAKIIQFYTPVVLPDQTAEALVGGMVLAIRHREFSSDKPICFTIENRAAISVTITRISEGKLLKIETKFESLT